MSGEASGPAGEQSEEDFIIENLELDGRGRQFEDADFMPIRQSLYEIESIAPQYDEEMVPFIAWCRPADMCEAPEYFSDAECVRAVQGSLPDDVFLGVLMAIAVYPGSDLIENVFASRPRDFRRYGIFTCRFYVEGEWVEVVTDTRIPAVRDQVTGTHVPAYSRSANTNEMWIPFIEKAYAKAVGNYESIQKAKIGEALLQLTGGSVQHLYLTNELSEEADNVWPVLLGHSRNDTMILAVANEAAETAASDAEDALNEDDCAGRGLLPGKLYSVIACKEIGGFELMLLHNPWTEAPCWAGSWSDASNDWETYPELLDEIHADARIKWRRSSPNGYFWMSFKSFSARFSDVHLCKVFPNSKYSYYCMRGEWAGGEAAGPCVTARDRETVVREAAESRVRAAHRAVAAEVVDGDCSWFNNPQFRVRCSEPTTLYISLVPLRGAELEAEATVEVNSAPVGCLSVVSYPRTTSSAHLWDSSSCEPCATEFVNGTGRVKGQEVSIWKQHLVPSLNYQIVPSTLRRGIAGSFILRVFSRHPVVVEAVDKLFASAQSGAWTKDSAGGSLRVSADGRPRENAKWCQNPQYHWRLSNLFGRDELNLKIVVRRTDLAPALKATGATTSADDPSIGLVICKAEFFYDAEEMAIRNKGRTQVKGKPRENAMGELIASRGSSLKPRGRGLLDDDATKAAPEKAVRVLRKTSLLAGGPLADAEYVLQSSFCSKREACIYFPKLPRAFVPTGLVIVPCLNQLGAKAKYDIEVYCSEAFDLTLIPDAQSKVLAGAWTESLSGGSHLHPSWKKNPKYSLRLKNTSKSLLGEGGQERQYGVRIALCRHGSAWRNKERKDTVGCMISFYVFVSRNNEQREVYAAPFVPTSEVCTEDDFKLAPLKKGEEYIIMPTTNAPGVHGNFVLSLMCDQEFIFGPLKDKSSSSSKMTSRGLSDA